MSLEFGVPMWTIPTIFWTTAPKIMGTSHSHVSPTEYPSGRDTVQKPIYIEANKLAYFSAEDVNNLQTSINEMAACRRIFDSWAAELTKWVSAVLSHK